MKMNMGSRCGSVGMLLSLLLLIATKVEAVPAFASQTGQPCANCHITGFSELTSFGRQFKLRGYALGEVKLPLSAGAVLSRTGVRDANVGGGGMGLADDRAVVLQRLPLYLAGRVADGAGGFVNWNYESAEKRGMMEMIDLRATSTTTLGGQELLLGLAVSNNPTVSDIYNSTPGFGFPHLSPASMSVVSPNAQIQLNNALASRVAGASVYGWWNNMLYAEVGAFRTADGALSLLGAGVPDDEEASIRSGAPYWRFAFERQWDAHSLMLGTYGLVVQRYPDPAVATGPTDRFRDVAIDTQYQYLTDVHRITSGLSWMHEKQNWNASFDPTGSASLRDAARNTLKTTRAHLTYFYRKMYGASLGWLDIRGGRDQLQYDTMMPVTGSIAGSPNTRAWRYELSYLPLQNVRLGLQYTAYQRFNGAKSNYDGFGRNARDNDVLYLWAWLLY